MRERLLFSTVALVLTALLPACSQRPEAVGRRDGNALRTQPVLFRGMCDASGAVPLGGTLFAVADDEENVLRVYDAARGGPALEAVDVSQALGLSRPSRSKSPPELDIEAATRVGDLAFWLGSHGRSSSGKFRQERLRLFATTSAREGRTLEVVGAYQDLLAALIDDPRYAPFDLARAAERAPKQPDGLNIEGLTARPEGGVWIGFRSPVVRGKALLASLENPEGVVRGAPARLGAPALLDLAGQGVRALSRWHGSYLIVAGPASGDRLSQLYRWDGHSAPHLLGGLDLSELNPEAFFTPEQGDRIMLLSDDGTRIVDGEECKRLDDPSEKQFRGVWVELPNIGALRAPL